MKTKASFRVLLAELEGDVRQLQRIGEQNARAQARIEAGASDAIDWGALGYTLHALYSVLENYFLRVSKFFENELPSDRWHKALVDKMALDIPAVRPPLLFDDSDRQAALELMRFRHRFRNLYGEDLDPDKTSEVQKTARGFLDRFPEIHRAFAEKLRGVSEGLE